VLAAVCAGGSSVSYDELAQSSFTESVLSSLLYGSSPDFSFVIFPRDTLYTALPSAAVAASSRFDSVAVSGAHSSALYRRVHKIIGRLDFKIFDSSAPAESLPQGELFST